MFFIGEEILAVDRDRRADAIGNAGQDLERHFLALLADDERHARLDDPALFGGDEFDAVAEKGLVVERYRGDHREGGPGDDVGGVEALINSHSTLPLLRNRCGLRVSK